ncbi:MAG: glycerol-3-phosphate dehydrogenase/oxidase [Proteobacteria bacterium]|nr:glycerol-3-phosphate dehydrogenase/oxidase [Pseudomonadota bacterium]
MQRQAFLRAAGGRRSAYDVIVIGGGANGLGIALDCTHRGLEVLLLERAAFGAGTSSRSSKLIHGGIRYLAQAQFGLVREALHERALLLGNAPGLVKPLPFILPAANRFELYKYAAGVKLYDALAGAHKLAASRLLDADETRRLVPQLGRAALAGSVCYADAAFDDTRLLQALAHAAAARGATLLNHMPVEALLKNARGQVRGVAARDALDGHTHEYEARVVINASGVHGDAVRRLADASLGAEILPSQGTHLVVPRRFHTSDHALVMPRTPDGRVMFVIPWHEHVLLGTTDTALERLDDPPRPRREEVDMILAVTARHLHRAPRHDDVLSCFAGVRPLAAAPGSARSSKISREHAITIDASGLVTVSGGKWTTYRRVAEQCVDAALKAAGLRANDASTRELALLTPQGTRDGVDAVGFPARGVAQIGAEQAALASPLHASLPYSGAHFAYAARNEMAMTVADALSYHTRALFIDARAALDIAPRVASIMASELQRDAAWMTSELERLRAIAAPFILTPTPVRETRG